MTSDVKVYRQVDLNGKVSSASPHVLIQMLYDGAVSNLNRVSLLQNQTGLSPQQRDMMEQCLSKAINIVSALQDSLDTSMTSELPHNLDRLYDYIQRRLLHARIQKDPGAVAECQSLIETLKSGWDIITQQVAENQV